MNKKSILIEEITSVIRSKAAGQDYCVVYEDKLYKIIDVDITNNFQPYPNAKGIKQTVKSEACIIINDKVSILF